MAKKSVCIDTKVKGYTDLVAEENAASVSGEVKNIPIDELHEFKDHPFKVRDDAKMEELSESIKKNGVLVPGIARVRPEGGYEIIAGHSRCHACRMAGISQMPMFVKEMSDDEATIVMVDSNIQREDIFPSEKARAYKMKYEAMKHQGAKGGNSLEVMSEKTGENTKTIQRYIRLSILNDKLLNLVDKKKLPFNVGVNLSFLNRGEQNEVEFKLIRGKDQISLEQSELLKKHSSKGTLNDELIDDILSDKGIIKKSRKFTLKSDRLNEYFDDNYTDKEIENIIIKLLEDWKSKEQQK